MKLGMVTYQLGKDWDLPTIIKHCEETGFEGVELRTTHAHGVETSLSPAKRAEVRKLFEKTPVKLAGLGTTCEYHSPDPAELRRNIEETKAWVDLAADLRCPGVKVRPNAFPDGVAQDVTLRQIGLALRECAEYGQHHGVQIRVEVHGRGTSYPHLVRTMLDIANHPYVTACWNSNATDVEEGSIANSFKQLVGRIGLVHTRDLFLANYPWRDLFRRLSESGYRGYVLIEAPETSDPIRVMRYMRALWDAYFPSSRA